MTTETLSTLADTDEHDIEYPPAELDLSHIVTEDDTPVDNIASAKQQRLLVEPLYSAHPLGERIFFADSNVGIFPLLHGAPLVPDTFLSLDVQPQQDWWEKKNRAYFLWEFGKAPEVVIEIVSNRRGGEIVRKVDAYARMRISYYVVLDPSHQLSSTTLRTFRLEGSSYRESALPFFPEIGLGLALWRGHYEDIEQEWLRWCTPDGALVPTGAELAADYARVAAEQGRIAAAQMQLATAQTQLAAAHLQRAESAEARLAALEAELSRLRGA